MKFTEVENSSLSDIQISDKDEPKSQSSGRKDIEITLHNGSVAKFRYPTTLDLLRAEKEIGSYSNDFPTEFYRILAEFCCIFWDNKDCVPQEDTMKASDDNKMCLAFIDVFREATKSAIVLETYTEMLPNGSEKAGFDAVSVLLSGNIEVLFNEPSQRDNKLREKADSNIEGLIILATNLCAKYNGEKLSLAEYRINFSQLYFDDFFKIGKVLTDFFR